MGRKNGKDPEVRKRNGQPLRRTAETCSREMNTGSELLIGLCRAGRCTVETERMQRLLTDGMVFVMPPESRVCLYVAAGSCECLWLDRALAADWLEDQQALSDFACQPGRFAVAGVEQRMVSRLTAALMEASTRPSARRDDVVRSLTGALLEWAVEQCPPDASPVSEDGGAICGALEYVATHYTEELRIAVLAERCHISEPHFRRLFHRKMGMGPLTYINRVRIMKACELLEKRESSVEDTARLTGFQSMTTFERNFRQITGMTPMQWRASAQRRQREEQSSSGR